jgi:hypothetical protein
VVFYGERTSGVGRRRQRRAITMCVSDVGKKKATLGGNQRRRVLKHKTHPIWPPTKETHPTSMRLQYEIIGNGLYSMLPIRQ